MRRGREGRRRALVRTVIAAVAVSALAPLVAALAPAGAAVGAGPGAIDVTRTADDHDPGSLRTAIDEANASGLAAVTIHVAAGTYDLGLCGAAPDDTNAAGDLDSTGSAALTIIGPASGATIRQTCAGERVLDHATGLLHLDHVTIAGGRAKGSPALGGGVRAQGPVRIDHATFRNNFASGDPGSSAGAAEVALLSGGDARGGAVFAGGEVTVADSVFWANGAVGGNGTTKTQVVGAGGKADGGAIATALAVHLSGSTFDANQASGGASGTVTVGSTSGRGGGAARGGAVAGGPADAANVVFTNNSARGQTHNEGGRYAEGGGLYSTGAVLLQDVTATANSSSSGPASASATSGSWASGGAVHTVGDLHVEGGTFDHNTASSSGGALSGLDVTIDRSTLHANDGGSEGGAVWARHIEVHDAEVSDNRARFGGGVRATGRVAVSGSRFTGNQAGGKPTYVVFVLGMYGIFGTGGIGGAIAAQDDIVATTSTFAQNAVVPEIASQDCIDHPTDCHGTVAGGALWTARDVDLEGVTVADNLVQGSTVSATWGGGISATTHAIVISNSTISGNRALEVQGPGHFGALAATTVDLTATTVVGNQGNGAIAGTLTARQSILAEQQAGTLCTGYVTISHGGNWTDDGSCALEDPTDHTDPAPLLLGPLQDNGGPTPTRMPAPTSPVVDVVAKAACASVTDQRGSLRPQGPQCDVGAVETGPFTLAADLTHTLTITAPGGPRIHGSAAITNAGPWPAQSAMLHLVLPLHSEVTSWTAPGWTCTTTPASTAPPGSVLLCTRAADLAVGATDTIAFDATGPGGLDEAGAHAESWVDAATAPTQVREPMITPLPSFIGLGSSFHAIAPVRLLDSRGATGGWNGPLAAGSPRTLRVAGGATGLPGGVDAVVLNVTVTGGSADSFLTVYPAGAAAPITSNLNFAADQTIPNLVTVKVGPDDEVAFANAAGATDVVVDIVGTYGASPDDRYTAVPPARLLDSRTPTGGWQAPLLAGAPRALPIAAASGPVPSTADAVVLNVTVTESDANSFLTVFPTGGSVPTASNLNFALGQTTANLVTVKLGAGGAVSFATAVGAVHVVADIVGYFDPTHGDLFHPTAPMRLLDSRTATGGWSGPLAAGADRELEVTGPPAGAATSVVANLTATGSTAGSYLTLFPSGTVPSTSSNLNFASGQTIPNLSITKVGGDGRITFRTNTGSTHVVYDFVGWFAPT